MNLGDTHDLRPLLRRSIFQARTKRERREEDAMAKVEMTRCDRCGRFDDEIRVFRIAVVALPDREVDLCDTCEADLERFVAGAKLARPRKAVQE